MIQIDIPMPKNCGACPICNEYLMCGVPCNGRGWGENDVSDYFANGRPEWCPLKEHEHGETFTVIDTKTGEEADEYEIALHEDWAKHLCYCDMEGWAIENDGTLLLVDECGRYACADRGRFKVVWNA